MNKKILVLIGIALVVIAGMLFSMTSYDRPDWSPEKIEVSLRPNLLYPSGAQIFQDSFDSPTLKWFIINNTGAVCGLSTATAFNGDGSLKLQTGTNIGSYSTASRYLSSITSEKIGADLWVNFPNFADYEFRLWIFTYTGTKRSDFGVKYSASTNKWYYYDSATNWIELSDTTFTMKGNTYRYNHIKLIVDAKEGKLLRLYVADSSIDLSEVPAWTAASASTAEIVIRLDALPLAANNRSLYVDEFVLTEE